ncbi:flagellin [Cupriavidus oxalaticus]|uniref:Flagellin n=1 Tax=Cupriavidus oxalaticus TaxID=96344 RepID=A0A375GIK8_9BURK|nr:flagellin [Cupriavidus oxalaticus]QRQ84689.1 flagellin [Cupriavidus oxalaticus]QRQ91222.1 flagellin [Cupriavidus oxalaticus]WQD85780.1 flagellin [Cupriavidus oxalaticus]SPC20699.1 flagellar filament structural protein (flagellin) [Cupriavidus oxalaticus]
MAQVINTNSLSLMTQNNMNASQSQLNTAIQRLSSGLRINSAKDDAAGQAIANRFTANIKGLTQAQRNANDGISLAQTTEGSLNEINNNLQRVRELSVQAANGTNSPSDLESIQAEIKQRLDEIDRVSAQTQFNGVKVLAGDSKMTIQVGAKDGETISINLKEITSKTLGLGNLDISRKSLDLSTVATAATTTVTPASSGATESVTLSAVDTQVAGAYKVYVDDADADKLYVSADGTTYFDVTSYDSATGQVKFDSSTPLGAAPTATQAAAGQELSVGGGKTVNVDNVKAVDTNAATAPDIYIDQDGNFYVSQDNGATVLSATFDDTTGEVSYDGADWGSAAAPGAGVALSAAPVTTYEIPPVAVPAVTADLSGLDADKVGSSPSLHKVTNEDGSDGGYVVKGSQNGSDVYYKANVATDGTVTLGEQYNPDPLAAIDDALASVDELRSQLGAVQNRFESSITNLANTTTNLSAARSRIQDADYATEVSNMTRAQILQQAGTSVLAQANQTTQNVLSLLR